MDLPTPSACSSCSAAHAEPVVRVEPTTMTIEHWGRLREGQLFATSRDVARHRVGRADATNL